MIRRHGDEYQFRCGDEWRTMKDPHAPATDAQLERLNREGRLVIGPAGKRISKLAAAEEIDRIAEAS